MIRESAEYVVEASGERVLVADIVRMTSFDLYQNAIHYDICNAMAARAHEDPTLRKVLENIYALKSRRARAASALSAYFSARPARPRALHVDPGVRSLLRPSLVEGVEVLPWRGHEPQSVDARHVLLLIAKAALHRMFRWFTRKRTPGGSVVRAWVEVTAKMYAAETREERVLIYPFALNFVRQLRFIGWCHRSSIDASLAGLPYRLGRIVAMWLKGVPRDLILAHAETDAARDYAAELLRNPPQSLFTSDEFETASFVLYDPLIAAGVRVINTAHGVGNYCPHINYSEFRVLSESQATFYSQRNPAIEYTGLDVTHGRLASLPPYRESLPKPPMLVLIHQPFEDSRLDAEAAAQRRLDATLHGVAAALSIGYGVKMHPNHRSSRLKGAPSKWRGEQIYDWSDLARFRPIFVTINSTAFFDVQGSAPVLVYEAPTFEPALYFPTPFSGVTLANAEASVRALLAPEAWARAAAAHAGETIGGSEVGASERDEERSC